MNTKIKTLTASIILSLFVLSACVAQTPQPAPATDVPDNPNLANPAAVYCGEQGYVSEIRTAEDGSQSGVCIFPDGSVCDEWAYFRDECAPGSDTVPAAVDPNQAQKDAIQNNAVEIVRKSLASQLNVAADSLDLISVEAVDWPDACLGLAQEGEMCAQMLTPGFRITFSAGNQNYVFHTDQAASLIRSE